jgi:hypothetical protein
MDTKRFRYAALAAALALGYAALSGGAAPGDKEIVVNSEQLAKDYTAGAKSFNEKYKDKIVVVTGTVEIPEAKDTIGGKRWLMLHGFKKKGDPVETMVRFEYIDDFKGLKEGAKVTLRGKALEHKDTVFAASVVDSKVVKK